MKKLFLIIFVVSALLYSCEPNIRKGKIIDKFYDQSIPVFIVKNKETNNIEYVPVNTNIYYLHNIGDTLEYRRFYETKDR